MLLYLIVEELANSISRTASTCVRNYWEAILMDILHRYTKELREGRARKTEQLRKSEHLIPKKDSHTIVGRWTIRFIHRHFRSKQVFNVRYPLPLHSHVLSVHRASAIITFTSDTFGGGCLSLNPFFIPPDLSYRFTWINCSTFPIVHCCDLHSTIAYACVKKEKICTLTYYGQLYVCKSCWILLNFFLKYSRRYWGVFKLLHVPIGGWGVSFYFNSISFYSGTANSIFYRFYWFCY